MSLITVEMNRLTMPKQSFASVSAAGDVEALMKRPNPGVPPNGLPIWEKLPLDAKLPMMASPKNAFVLYTTKLCKRIHKSSKDHHDFILHDPDARFFSNKYQTLHDPHLRSHFSNKQMKKRLYRGGFITKDDKVLCTLKEFNQYRQYLRRINLEALSYDRRKKDNEDRAKIGGEKPNHAAAGSASINKAREIKVREIRMRLQEQYEADKERYKKILLDHEARRERMTNERINKMTENEQKRIAERARREAVLKKQEMEEIRRKMHIHRKWMIEDEMRRARADERRLNREITLQNQLEEAWEQRKHIQQQRIRDEETTRQDEDEQRKKNIQERETSIMKQRKKQDAVFLKKQDQTKKEREKKEAIYRQRLEKEIERRRAERAAKMRKKSRRTSTGLQSEWKLEETLTKDHPPEDGTSSRKYSKEELGVTDLRGARFSKEYIIEKDTKRHNSCNFACLLLPFETKAEDNDIPLGAPIVNKRLEYLQREIRPKQSFSNINLQLIATDEVDDKEPNEDKSPPVTEPAPLMIKKRSATCIENFQENFNAVASKLSGSLESLASFVVDWTINIAQMIAYPGTSLSTSLCSQCENDLKQAYSPSRTSSEEDRLREATERGVRFSLVEETIPCLPRTCSDDEGEDIETLASGSFVGLKLKDSLTRLRENQISMETLTANLKTLLRDLEAGKLLPSDVERLEGVTRDILQSAVTVADSVNAVAPEDELRADAGKKRSAILIEALISHTVDDALEQVKHSSEVTATPSELLGDMIGYALNEAVDQTKNLDPILLARDDSQLIRQHLEDTMQRALWDVDHRRMSAEGILVANIIQNVIVSVTTDIRTGRLSKTALENLAMAIVRSNDLIRQSQSDTAMATRPPVAHGQKAHEYIRTALLKIMEAIDRGELSGNEVAAMADRMCSSIYDAKDDGGFKRMTSPSSVSVMSAFVKEVINNCLNQLTEDTAARTVSWMINEASSSPVAREDDAAAVVAARDDVESADQINTFVQNVLNKSLDDSDDEAEKQDSYLSGAVTETVIEAFITGVLSGSGEKASSGKPNKSPAGKTSLTGLVMNGFLKNVINSAIDQCQPEEEPQQSNASAVDDDTPSQIVAVYVREVVSKGKVLSSKRSSDTIVSQLAKEVSSTLVDHVDKNKSNETPDDSAPKGESSVDLMAHTHESHSGIFSDESSDEEEKLRNAEPLEVEITPCLRNKLLDIDPQETSPALSAISMRSSMAGHLAHRFEATARNSFASLIHPDLSRVRGLKHDSADDVKRKLHDVYVQSVMRISRDTVVCADEMHEPGTVSDSSSDDDDEDNEDEIKAIDGCPSAVVAKAEDGPSPTKTTSNLRAISPVMSKSSKTSKEDGAKSNSQTRIPRQAGSSSRNVALSHSRNGISRQPSSSNKIVASTSNSIRKASSSGARTGGTAGAKKDTSIAKGSSSRNSRSSLQKLSSQTSATSTKSLPGKPSPSQNPLTTKSSKKTASSTTSTGSVSKTNRARSKASDTGKAAEEARPNETQKVNSAGSSSSKKSPARSGSKTTSQQVTKKTPSGGSTGSRGSGRAGPAETGSINDLRVEKEMNKSLSGRTLTGLQSTTSTGMSSTTKQTSDSKLRSGNVSKGHAVCASAAVPGRMSPSDSAIGSKSPTEEHPAAAVDVPRILSDGEVVKVRSLYGSFSSTIQVRSNTDVQKTDSGTKVDTKSSNILVTPKSSASVR